MKWRDVRAGPTRRDAGEGPVHGRALVNVPFYDADGALCRESDIHTVTPSITGTTDWRRFSEAFASPSDAATLQLQLSMDLCGTLWHDGITVVEIVPSSGSAVQRRVATRREDLAVWPVNAVVKVLHEDLAPEVIPEASISMARNEKEPLQLAVRSDRALGDVRVEVDPPVGPDGAKLEDIELNVVGYVPIDYPTSYYFSISPAWHRKHPKLPPRSDGWAGWWPDPLLPPRTVRDSGRTDPGRMDHVRDRQGRAGGRLSGQGASCLGEGRPNPGRDAPFAVHVWDFTLPDENHVKAIFDIRFGHTRPGHWNGDREDVDRQVLEFMAKRRLCPDQVRPDPKLSYEDGRVVADFTEFDKAASHYFDDLKLPHCYTPRDFYLFGWAHPPSRRFGESPYPGPRPHEGADRGRLRPEFKKAYQACLKAYWDHLKEKGWDKRVTHYISDEPLFNQQEVVAQMKALCEMIHEVDPAIPIYSSIWHHVPDWDGHIDVWGLSHFGWVSVERMRKLRDAGERIWFTTDGQMCIDTPYCAVERLLPHYCFETGAEGYEYWGVAWHTRNPYRVGWHVYDRQSTEPGKSFSVRFPNGDGFLIYPGGPIGHDGPVSSIRLEQAREGVEDYEYFHLLRNRIARAKASGRDTTDAEAALRHASTLVAIPNAGGQRSSRVLPDPDAVFTVRQRVALAIESFQNEEDIATKQDRGPRRR